MLPEVSEVNEVTSPELKKDHKENRDSMNHQSQSHLIQSEPVAKLPQLYIGFLALFPALATGTTYGWSSPVLVKLTSEHDSPLGIPLTADSDELAWITSLLVIGSLIAPYFGGILADRIGRKLTLLISATISVAAYVLLFCAYQVWFMYIGRLLQGFSNGFVIAVFPLYMSEISSDEVRGILGSFLTLCVAVGVVYAYSIGPYVSYYVLQMACGIIPLIFFVAFFLIPESPIYCVSKGRKSEAEKALRRLGRNSDEVVQNEIAMIESLIEQSRKSQGSILDIFRIRANLKAFLICFGLISSQMASGMQILLFYTQVIFEKTRTDIDSGLSSIVVAVCQLVGSICAPIVINWFGRKRMLLFSLGLQCLGLICIGLFFYLNSIGIDTSSLTWLPLLSMMLFFFISSVGMVPVPFIIIGEIFVPNIKAKASSILASYGSILAFVLTKWFPTVQAALGNHVGFWIFAGFCSLAFVFVLFAVFETKGLSLKAIQDRLNGGENRTESNSNQS